jgi:ribosome-associated toxin RatA of RatAB toxin-antitoxin module
MSGDGETIVAPLLIDVDKSGEVAARAIRGFFRRFSGIWRLQACCTAAIAIRLPKTYEAPKSVAQFSRMRRIIVQLILGPGCGNRGS